MPARATSSATISFGLVSIPVKVYTATQSKSLRFNMLDGRDKSRIKQQYVNASSGEPVPREEIVKGYEYARGQYVVLAEEELKALEQKTNQAIEIEEFVPIERVDPLYFEKSNLLGPDKGGQKAYRLLNEAMTLMGVVAIGRYATRGKQQLVLIRPTPLGLMMQTLFYADEVRGFDEVDMGDELELRDSELELAQQLIKQLSKETFDAGRYEDEYRQKVLAAVEQKIAGEDVVIQPKEEAKEQIIDLVAALKASIAAKGESEPADEEADEPAAARERKPAQLKAQAKPARKRAPRKKASA